MTAELLRESFATCSMAAVITLDKKRGIPVRTIDPGAKDCILAVAGEGPRLIPIERLVPTPLLCLLAEADEMGNTSFDQWMSELSVEYEAKHAREKALWDRLTA